MLVNASLRIAAGSIIPVPVVAVPVSPEAARAVISHLSTVSPLSLVVCSVTPVGDSAHTVAVTGGRTGAGVTVTVTE
jgi:hypothetical protein